MKLFFLFSFFAIMSISFAQSNTDTLDYTFYSKTFNDERTISVFLPPAYIDDKTSKNFAVAYVFDGQFSPYFNMVNSMISYYEQSDEGVPLIVVSIHSKKRWGEFVPIDESKESTSIQGADKLSLFLKDEVIPYIDSNYRTKDFKIGIGHSLGGTFVVNEIVKENSIFNAVIAASPNLRMYNEQILNNASKYFENSPDNHRFIYTSAGDFGAMENGFRKSVMKLDSICLNADLKNMYWNFLSLENHNHMTTFVPTFNYGYIALSSQLMLLNEQLLQMTEKPNSSITEDLKKFYNDRMSFSDEEQIFDFDLVMENANRLNQFYKFKESAELYVYASELLEQEDLSKHKKKVLAKKISSKKLRAEFYALASEAKQYQEKGNYEEASVLYLKAFDLDLIKATHYIRIDAVPVLAQAGKIDEAFFQLDLLANRYKLGGNKAFIDNKLCKPLHKDKRWTKLMDKLAKNAKLYQ